jgi:hypothetical protein
MWIALIGTAFAIYKIAKSRRVCVSAGPFKICND